MPEVLSIGLGGGSIIEWSAGSDVQVGPLSVGSRLLNDSQCCDGKVITATDIAVKAGILQNFGNPDKVEVDEKKCTEVLAKIKIMVENIVDRIKVWKYYF